MSFSLKNIVAVISFLPTLDTLISSTVTTIEQSLSGFTGSQKFQAAEAKVNSFVSTLSADVNVISDLQAIAGPLINAWVAAFNVAGLFKHASSTAATQTPAA